MEEVMYWTCQIGPVEKSKVPYGGDFPIRRAVETAFSNMVGEYADHCWSGWGCTEELNEVLLSVKHASKSQIEQIKKILHG